MLFPSRLVLCSVVFLLAGCKAASPNDASLPSDSLRPLLKASADWIMTLGLRTNNITGAKDTLKTSIFINGNLARVLLASYRLTGNKDHLDEGLSWCDTFISLQTKQPTHDSLRTAGWWDTGYSELFIADTGTAVTTLALCYDIAKTLPTSSPFRKASSEYWDALLAFDAFVQGGTATTPQCTFTAGCAYDAAGGEKETASGFVNKSTGALGDGYYMHSLNGPDKPYTISTALSGGVFYSELFALSKKFASAKSGGAVDETFKEIASGAVRWLLGIRNSNGTIPYVITPPTTAPHDYQCISYAAESFVDVFLRFPDLRHGSLGLNLPDALNSTVEFVLEQQCANGQLVQNGTRGEIQRSPRAVSLLQLFYQNATKRDPRIVRAVGRYFDFLRSPDGKEASGLNAYALPTGFIGLAVADLIQPWVTFSSI